MKPNTSTGLFPTCILFFNITGTFPMMEKLRLYGKLKESKVKLIRTRQLWKKAGVMEAILFTVIVITET